MKRPHIILICLFLSIIAGATACSHSSEAGENYSSSSLSASKLPVALTLNRGKLSAMPPYDKYLPKPFQIDLRSYDLTSLDLGNCLEELQRADFDRNTKWPYRLPAGYNPKKVMKSGENPGLHVTDLHKKGITGKGIGIAIIGEPILIGHDEYKDSLRYYEELSHTDYTATTSGMISVSVSAGNRTGVAPDADIYYFSLTPQTEDSSIDQNSVEVTENPEHALVKKAVEKIIEINSKLPHDKKIRIVYGNFAWNPKASMKPLEDLLKKLEAEGIAYILQQSCTFKDTLYYNGLSRNPLKNPDNSDSYTPGNTWSASFYSFGSPSYATEALLVPMDSRTAAAPTGTSDYAFYATTDITSSTAYIAGLYALACQAAPAVTPESFWKAAMKTGDTNIIETKVARYKLGIIVNPVKLIEEVERSCKK